jgi:hypothetical protein
MVQRGWSAIVSSSQTQGLPRNTSLASQASPVGLPQKGLTLLTEFPSQISAKAPPHFDILFMSSSF